MQSERKTVMKKIIALTLFFAMALSFGSCSKAKRAETAARGKIEHNVYTNDSIGMSFSPAEGWVFLSDEEIAGLYSTAVENYFAEETGEIIENADVIYDLYAYNAETGGSLNVNFENLGILYGENYDEESYLAASRENIAAQLLESGMPLSKADFTEVKVHGKKYPCLVLEINMIGEGGLAYPIKEMLFARKVGSYMGVVTVTAMTDNEISEILDMIKFN